MNEFLEIAARCYDANGRGENLHPVLREFITNVHEKVVLANSGPHCITGSALRSSQVVALACQTWEALNPTLKPYTP